MIITPENLVRHELIGLHAEVVNSTNRCLVGAIGRVVDETRNMLHIETDNGVKSVSKAHTCFVFTLPHGQTVKANGSVLVSQPENRIHKKIRKSRWKL